MHIAPFTFLYHDVRKLAYWFSRSNHISDFQSLAQCSRIRIFRFFQISKKHDFLRFFEMTEKKRKKSVAKIWSSMTLTLLQKRKSLLNVYRNFGLKTPRCYGYV